MNREDIIRMAHEAGLTDPDLGDGMVDYGNATEEIVALARLIAEDCAKRCVALAEAFDESLDPGHACGADACAVEIREAYKP